MLKFAANLSMLYIEYDFLDRFQAAAKSGFRGVEYLFPYDFPPNVIAKNLQENNLTQVLFNLPCGDWAGGERGIACIPDRVEEFKKGVDKAIEYAKVLNCTQVNCLAGKKPASVPYQKAYETLVSNLKYASNKLQAEGIRLVFEAINTIDIPDFFVSNTQQAWQIMDDVGCSNLSFQYDIYHMQIMEGDLVRTILNNLNKIGHIQLADNPGRHEPGDGEINYHFIFAQLLKTKYQGWIGCEYIPKTNTESGLIWLKTHDVNL